MPRLWRWLVPITALMVCAFTRAGASAEPNAIPGPAGAETRIDRASQRATFTALAFREQREAAERAQRRAEANEATALIKTAEAQVGDPYGYGAGGPDAFDCSGLTSFVFARAGIELPHNSHGQAAMGEPVARRDIRRGDLVFFSTAGPGASHVGIATSATTAISATSSGGVMEHPTDDAYWGGSYVTARRVR
jgi:cell wall-associated NlpC family hydrolase